MKNLKERSENPGQDFSEMNQLLLQTIIEKIDHIEGIISTPGDKRDSNDHLSSMVKQNTEYTSKLVQALTNLHDNLPGTIVNAVQKTLVPILDIKEVDSQKSIKERLVKVGLLTLSCALFISTLFYSIKYYYHRGNHTKYEFLQKHGPQNIQNAISNIDSLYEKNGNHRFVIKYMEDE